MSKSIDLIDQSGTYETAAWGKEDVPAYYNQILKVTTGLSPHELLKTCLGVEKVLGRTREEKWSSRTIDIDIVYYGNWLVLGPDLKIPHPYRAERKFIMTMMNDFESSLIDPVYQVSVKELNENCKDILEVTLIS